MASSNRPPAPCVSARCPRCGLVFDCGRGSEPFACWCAAMPTLPGEWLAPDMSCLCPACFAAELAAAGAAPSG